MVQAILIPLLLPHNTRGKERKNIKLNNFDENCIKVNKDALTEMERLRRESILDCPHPLKKMTNPSISYINIVKWTKHIEHFLSDTIHAECSSLFCFTETNIVNEQHQRIKDYLSDWDDIHHSGGHGLAICYNTLKVQVIKQYNYSGTLEVLPVLLKVDHETIFLVVVYRPPGPIRNFANTFMEVLDSLIIENQIQEKCRLLIVGDFNLDQMLPEHVTLFEPLCSRFNLFQRSNYSTHIKGGILDLVFDDKRDTDVDWLFSPFSDHFVLLIEL